MCEKERTRLVYIIWDENILHSFKLNSFILRVCTLSHSRLLSFDWTSKQQSKISFILQLLLGNNLSSVFYNLKKFFDC